MAAANDTRQMEKQFHVSAARTARNQLERLIHDGESFYYARIFLGHLYEAGLVFRSFYTVDKNWVESTISSVAAGKEEAQAALTRLDAAFRGSKKTGFFGLLSNIRNLAAFHYKQAAFGKALATARDSEVVIASPQGFTRYTVVDALVGAPIREAAKEKGIHLPQAIEHAVQLGWDLETLVWHLLPAYLRERPTTWHLEPTDRLLFMPLVFQKTPKATRWAGLDT